MKKNAFVIVLYLVVLASFATVCFLAFYYVPKYKEIFRSMTFDLPLISQQAINISNSFATNLIAAVACGVVIISSVWWIPSLAIKTVCFSLLLLANTFLGLFLYSGIQVAIIQKGRPHSIFMYIKQRINGQDTTVAYEEMIRSAKSPEFIDELEDAYPFFVGDGIHAVTYAKNKKAVVLINTILDTYFGEQEEFDPLYAPEFRKIFLTSIYGLYKINGTYPEDVSKKLEVYNQSERLILLARFMCHDKSVLRDLLKHYPVHFVHNFATWSPEAIEKDTQPQVDFKDVPAHDILKYITQAVYILPQ